MPSTLTLGRDPAADILIADPSISRRHAEIVLMDDRRIFVRDLGTANGTRLIRGGMSAPLEREIVSRGDEVQFGDITLDFEMLHDMLLEKLGRAQGSADDDAPADDRRDQRDQRDGARERQHGQGDGGARGGGARGGADRGALTKPGFAEFLPIGSFHLLKEKGLLLPAILFAALLLRLMWLRSQSTPESIARFLVEFTVSLAVVSFFVVYRLCGKRKPWKMIVAVMAMEAAIMSMHSVIDNPFCDATGARRILLREGLADGSIPLPKPKPQGSGAATKEEHSAHVREAGQPAEEPPASGGSPSAAPQSDAANDAAIRAALRPSFFAVWYAYFCCAGLLEELEKMLPVLLLLWATTASRQASARQWGVSEPLDAIVYACATALAFIIIETFGATGYVGGKLEAGRLDDTLIFQAYTSFPLAIIRTIKALAGHLAYSGYFAYFVGLGILRPAHRERLWLGGWIGAALIHGLFNATAGKFVGPIISVTSFFFLLAVILKARQISPTRDENFATRAVPRHKLT